MGEAVLASHFLNRVPGGCEDPVFDVLGEGAGEIRAVKGAAAFVFAFLNDFPRGEIPEHVIAVSHHPSEPVLVLGFQRDRIINKRFTADADEKEVFPERDGLDRALNLRGNGLPAVDLLQKVGGFIPADE